MQKQKHPVSAVAPLARTAPNPTLEIQILKSDQPCITRFELAQLLRVSVRTVDRMIAGGEIRVRRVRGKAVRFLREDVERYLEKAPTVVSRGGTMVGREG